MIIGLAVVGVVAIVALVAYILYAQTTKRRMREKTDAWDKATDSTVDAVAAPTKTYHQKRNTNSNATMNKKQRTVDANFTDPWMYTTLKGHTGQVMDFEFSSNGKYIATCAEDGSASSSVLVHKNHLINNEINENDEESVATTSSSSSNSCSPEDSPNPHNSNKKQRKFTKKKTLLQNRKHAMQNYNNNNSNNHNNNNNNNSNNNSNTTAKAATTTTIKTVFETIGHSSPAKTNQQRNNNKTTYYKTVTPPTSFTSYQHQRSPSSTTQSSSATTPFSKATQNGRANTNKISNVKKLSSDINNCKKQPPQSQFLPLRQFVKLNLSESELVDHLKKYILEEDMMLKMGFPIEADLYSEKAMIYKVPHHFFSRPFDPVKPLSQSSTVISSNKSDQEDTDSGQGSGSSSPTNVDDNDALLMYRLSSSFSEQQLQPSLERECCRCGKPFFSTLDGEYLTQEHCISHWGKMTRVSYQDNFDTKKIYSCCNGDPHTTGCTINKQHVWTGLVSGYNGPFDDFVRTKPSSRNEEETAGIFALDCEMSYTKLGLELTKVTVVGFDGRMVYQNLVKPESEILDYNTRFSGVSEEDFQDKTNYVTLKQVQKDLLKFIRDDTILIGHSIENDLKVLKIIHKTVIDTSVIFPHHIGFPFRQSLKILTKNILKRDIQMQHQRNDAGNQLNDKDNNLIGHCSVEDSRASLELMLWRLRKDLIMYDNSSKTDHYNYNNYDNYIHYKN